MNKFLDNYKTVSYMGEVIQGGLSYELEKRLKKK